MLESVSLFTKLPTETLSGGKEKKNGTYLRLSRIHGQVQYPQKPEEVACAGMQTDAPIRKHREQQRTHKQVRQRADRVREDVRARAVQPVHTLPHEHLPLLEERGDPRDGHKPEERDGEEVY